jgi:hypothetical protein
MDDEQILSRGGSEDDIKQYAERNGADVPNTFIKERVVEQREMLRRQGVNYGDTEDEVSWQIHSEHESFLRQSLELQRQKFIEGIERVKSSDDLFPSAYTEGFDDGIDNSIDIIKEL